jgi:2-keto-4-pentenoate hydratase/2-oxohepta-3-ene-1,7-dioic acid hydratase in catechol pathway
LAPDAETDYSARVKHPTIDKIICLGKNYAEHARELGDAVPDKPVVFLKPPSVLKVAGNGETLQVELPPQAGLVHHECEIVLRLNRGGYRLSLAEAEKAIGEVTVGLDMTLRDLQTELKKGGHPWTTSKVFLDSAIIGPWISVGEFPRYLSEPFSLKVDGESRQSARGEQMLFGPAQSVSYLSALFPLVEGDLVFTGTPKGVGPIRAGQKAQLQWGPIAYSVVWK